MEALLNPEVEPLPAPESYLEEIEAKERDNKGWLTCSSSINYSFTAKTVAFMFNIPTMRVVSVVTLAATL